MGVSPKNRALGKSVAADSSPMSVPTNLVAGSAGPTIKSSQPCPYLYSLRTQAGLGCVDQTSHVAIGVLVLVHQLVGMSNFIKAVRL